MDDKIYIGGSRLRVVSRFDMKQEKWYQFPQSRTLNNYRENCLLWFDKMDYNLLFLASSTTNCMEYIDIREGKNWINVCSNRENERSLQQSFGIVKVMGDLSRLLVS